MEKIVAVLNLAAGITYDTLEEGDPAIVSRITLLVPGVLNGSQGPILYELQDIEDSDYMWDGMPILLGHPMDRLGSEFSEEDQTFLGRVRFPRVENGKLVADGYFHLENMRKYHRDLLNRIQAGKKIEVSTGLKINTESASGTDRQGRYYNRIARNYEPDHLAVLVDQVGACSLHDGCGVNNERTTEMCTCSESKIVCNDQNDLLGTPDWDFSNPLDQSKEVANRTGESDELLGTPSWEFENPLK